nr:hypothetical protein [Ancylobacter mangrovi]
MRQEAATSGQIAPEAWRAMSEAAERAGLPLDQWLKAQLLSTTGPQEGAGGDISDLQRRVQELAGRIEQLVAVRPESTYAETSHAEAPEREPAYAEAAYAETAYAARADVVPARATPAAPPAAPRAPDSADGRIDAALRQINERIEAMNRARPRPAARVESRVEENDRRLGDILRAAETVSRRDHRLPSVSSAQDIEAAVAEIAARQSELEGGRAERRPDWRGPERAPERPAEPRPAQQHPSRPAFEEPASFEERAASTRRPLHEQRPAFERFAPEFARHEFARPEPTTERSSPREGPTAPLITAPPITSHAAPAPSGEVLDALQRELAEMRQGLSSLAPRRSVDELQRTVARLAERVERTGAGDDELRATLLALRDMIGALKLPEHPSVLTGRIDTLARKIDIVSAKTVDGAAIARLQAQASEIRDLLGRAISNDAVRLLAEQVAILAAKVSQMAGADEALIRSAVGGLEKRIDALSERIATPPSALTMDEIQRRLETIQQGLAAARREGPQVMETGLRDIAARLERIERVEPPAPAPDHGPRFDALSRQIAEITGKLDAAAPTKGLGDRLAGQLSTIERAVNDLFIQMEETRATVLANAGHRGRPQGGGNGGNGASLLKREIAAIEAARAAAPSSAPASSAAPAPAPASAPAPVQSEAPAAPVATPPQAAQPAVPPATYAAPSEPVFTPEPASIPKPFEPQLMRAALEELSRSPEAAAAFRRPAPRAPEPRIADPLAEADDTGRIPDALGDIYSDDGRPTRAAGPHVPAAVNDDADPQDASEDAQENLQDGMAQGVPAGAAPARTQFIAQARRAAQPATVVIPQVHSRIGERAPRRPTPWLARIRAMLLIGLCGSALAYGSWHLLSTMREGQLRASGPSSLPATARGAGPSLEDITGSVGKPSTGPTSHGDLGLPPPVMPSAPAPLVPGGTAPDPDAPDGVRPQAPGPSSFNQPSDLPGSIGSPALRAAALSGDPDAAFEIGRRYIDGIGVATSAVRAVEWFELAANHGSVPAAYRLGSIYEKGTEGVPRDVAKARQLYEQAADAGNVRAMHNLGVLLAAGIDGQPDYRDAVRWFRRAAEFGLRDSQYNLAVLYARGFGVAVNLGEAWRWFSLAAAGGDSEAAAKRDEVASKMDTRTLAAARASLDGWTPRVVDAKANGSDAPDWQHPDSLPRKTASR